MAPTTLDPRAARPLTSREISKVLSSILGGVVAVSPKARDHVAGVVEAVLRSETAQAVDRLATGQRYGGRAAWITSSLEICPSWAVAFSATVSGLRGWCDPADIKTALTWVAENINLICQADTAPRSN